jgi:NADPH:quinone reductase-like Zn-dependent oxidoreductase
MRAYEIQQSFGLDHLQLTHRPTPAGVDGGTPPPGRAVVRIRAVSLNYRDLLTVQGHYNPRQPLPLVPCSDGAGEVVAVGEGVERVKPGDRVLSIFAQKWLGGVPTPERLRSTLGGPLDGTLQEYLECDAEGLVHTPEHLSDEQAATLTCAGVTAWSALVTDMTHGPVGPGDTVLTLGTGGVSIFALQLGRVLGARVIVTSSSDDKLARAEQLGAWKTINYRSDTSWGKTAREATGGRGVDVVVEVGGGDTLSQSLQAVRMGGQVSLIGVLSGVAGDVEVTRLLMNRLTVQGILVGDRDRFEALNRAVEAAGMEPVVDEVFAFEDAREAFERMRSGEHFGKLVIRVGD